MAPDRIYRHFCMTARALEAVGERWSLLVVRDLLPGPRRFTDLVRSLHGITPTRLTARLRQLEAAGVLVREPAETGREVWYRLTDAGRALEPAVDALTLWGVEHALEPPVAGESVGAEAAMTGTKVWLNRYAAAAPDGLSWVWRFRDDGYYTLRFQGDDYYTLRVTDGVWELARGKQEGAAITVETTCKAWASFLTAPAKRRRLPSKDVALEGSRAEVRRFAKAFAAKLVRP
jgi:DNA-binding HxlR family transcriptional regulator